MFLDQVKVEVRGGKGGDGMVAFRREKYVPMGGPAGGDGGHGGSVIFKVDEGLRTLMDFRYNRHFFAKNGENGMSKGMHGKNSPNLYVKVPAGTTVKDANTNEILDDLVEHGQELVVAQGGRGGRGNIKFATPRNPAPELSENGEPGIERTLELELKVLADVGLVGFPSVGKSTLLSVISKAKPKIGAYPFTTIHPNLGMVHLKNGNSFVVADLPGLIEGASEGVGLGDQFLKHIERTRVILHVIDMGAMEGREPFEDYIAINKELENYNLELLKRPQIIVANKMDEETAEQNLSEFKKQLNNYYPEEEKRPKIFPISGFTHQGLDNLLNYTGELVNKTPKFELNINQDTKTEEHNEKEFIITRNSDGSWNLSGDKIEKLYKMTNFAHDESIMRFSRQLRAMGVDQELRNRGAKDGDNIHLLDFVFEFVE